MVLRRETPPRHPRVRHFLVKRLSSHFPLSQVGVTGKQGRARESEKGVQDLLKLSTAFRGARSLGLEVGSHEEKVRGR